MSYIDLAGSWAKIVHEYPPGLIEFGATILIQLVGFWMVCSVYLAIDLTIPEFSNRHKLQSERRQPSWASIKHCVWHVLIGNISSATVHFAVHDY
jgi:hypothetical protein